MRDRRRHHGLRIHVAGRLARSGRPRHGRWAHRSPSASTRGGDCRSGASARCSSSPDSSVFLATLAEASSPEIHAIGRISGWFVEPLLIYLILAFPSGRLTDRLDRRLVGLRRAARGDALPPDGAAGRALPRALPLDRVSRRLPGQRLHDHVLRARARRGPRAPPARGPADPAPDRGDRARRAAHPQGEPPHAAHALARAVRCDLPAGELRRAPRPAQGRSGVGLPRRLDVGPAARRPRAGGRVHGRARALAAVHRGGDAAPRDPALLPPAARGSARRARRGLLRPVAGDRLLGRATGVWADAAGRPVRAAGRGVGAVPDRDPRRREADRGDRARRRAARRARLHRRRDGLRRDDARQPPARRGGRDPDHRGPGLARPDPGDRRRRAPPDRARPA